MLSGRDINKEVIDFPTRGIEDHRPMTGWRTGERDGSALRAGHGLPILRGEISATLTAWFSTKGQGERRSR